MSEYRVSPTEEERKKEKSRFLTVSGSVCRRPLWKVPLCVLVVFHTQVTIMTVRRLDFIHRLSYFRFCNVLHIWTIRAIPTYRVYRLYDIYASSHFSPRNQICCLASRSAIITMRVSLSEPNIDELNVAIYLKVMFINGYKF